MQKSNNYITVVVADGDVMACRLLASGLRRYRKLRVFESSLPAPDVVKQLSEIRPDILLVGTSLPGPISGFALVREVRKIYPGIGIVALLESSQRKLVVEAFRSGAKGVFCRSDFEFKALWKCVSSVKRGQIWANSEQLQFVMETLGELTPLRVINSEGACLLTRREEEVVREVAEGLSNREIGEHLQLSQHTVKNYLFRIFEKLGISNRVELVAYAVAHAEGRCTLEAPVYAHSQEPSAARRTCER